MAVTHRAWIRRILWGVCLALAAGADTQKPTTRPTFVNPVYRGADPWIVKHGPAYYSCRSEGGYGIGVYKSDRLTERGERRIVWRPKSGAWNSRGIWAPELHRVRDKWYIYYAATSGENADHRAGVLEALTDDPQGEYRDRGMLYTGDDPAGRLNNRWAIDATPLEIGERLYLIWSGWPSTEDVQYLYIARMSDPCTVSGNRVRLCANDTYLWERVSERREERGLNEGPEVLKHDGRVMIVYSCSGSWEATYKLGLLTLDEKADPLNPASWRKLDKPVFQSSEKVFGVGHACFVKSPDGSEDWLVYHAKVSRSPGWQRMVHLQPFRWTPDGPPDFGWPVDPGTPIGVPSGEQGGKPSSRPSER